MAEASIKAVLGLDNSGFVAGAKVSQAELTRLNTEAKQTAGTMALMQQSIRAVGSATSEETAKLRALGDHLADVSSKAKIVSRELKKISEARDVTPAPGAAALPDESARYQAHLKRVDEQERSARANAAIRAREDTYQEQRRKDAAYADASTRAADGFRSLSEPQSELTRVSLFDHYARERATIGERGKRKPGQSRGSEPDEPEDGGGSARMANMEAGHSIRSIFDLIGAGQDPAAALRIELPRLAQAAGLSLGAQIVLEIIPAVLKAVEGSLTGVEVERKKYARELGGDGSGLSVTAESSLRTRISDLRKARDERLEAGGVDGGIRNWVGPDAAKRGFFNLVRKVTGRESVEDEEARKAAALDEARIRDSAELARRKAESVALDRRAFREGEAAVALEREQFALRERIRAVQDDKDEDEPARNRIIASLREESTGRENLIKQAQRLKLADSEAKRADADQRAVGGGNELDKAQNAYIAAVIKRDAYSPDSQEYADADTEVAERGTDVRRARGGQAEREAQRHEERRMANLRGSQLQREDQRLTGAQQDLEGQLDVMSPTYEFDNEKRADVETALAKNQQQRAEFEKQKKLHAIDIAGTEDQASTGRGADAQLALMGREMGRINERRNWNDAQNGGDKSFAADLDEKAHALTQAMRDVTFQENQRLTALRNASTEAKNQVTHAEATPQDKKDAIDRRTSSEVAAAQNRGASQEEIDAITSKGETEKEVVDVDEIQMTPQARLARQRKNDARAAAAKRQEQIKTGDFRSDTQKEFDASFDAKFHPERLPVPSVPQRATPDKGAHDTLTNDGIGKAVASALKAYVLYNGSAK